MKNSIVNWHGYENYDGDECLIGDWDYELDNYNELTQKEG